MSDDNFNFNGEDDNNNNFIDDENNNNRSNTFENDAETNQEAAANNNYDDNDANSEEVPLDTNEGFPDDDENNNNNNNNEDEDDDNINNDESQEFVLDDDDGGDGFIITESQQVDPIPIRLLQSVVNTYSAYIYTCPAKLINGYLIHLEIPRNFLPLSLQAVYGFLGHNNLLEITLELDDYDWNRKPKMLKVEHPLKKDKYVGYPLVQTACHDFFSSSYQPRAFYRAESYLLTPSGEADEKKVKEIVQNGFDRDRAANALVLCSNSVSKAIQFLKTGELPPNLTVLTIEYSECPLLYLVLEILECFLDLQDHCCICRAQLTPGLKPSICDNSLCTFQFTQVGVGSSVSQEIQRDPMAADLIFSIFSAAIGSKYFQPRPPGFEDAELTQISASLPPMRELTRFADDVELNKCISARSLELLRWVLLSNRSHMLYLQNQMQFTQFGNARQYLSLISTPAAERKFKTLKEKYGTFFLFHGSEAVNWHSILRNGLKNASGTSMQVNGAALGPGIYFARASTTSQGYARQGANRYLSSVFGKTLTILALCEIAKVKELKDHGWAHTLTNEEACIVRFLLVNGEYNVDILDKPPENIPKLKDVLNYHAENI